MPFQLIIPELTPVSLLESVLEFEIDTQLAVSRKTIFTSIVHNDDSCGCQNVVRESKVKKLPTSQ